VSAMVGLEVPEGLGDPVAFTWLALGDALVQVAGEQLMVTWLSLGFPGATVVREPVASVFKMFS